jgi:hypothetical protein
LLHGWTRKLDCEIIAQMQSQFLFRPRKSVASRSPGNMYRSMACQSQKLSSDKRAEENLHDPMPGKSLGDNATK